MKTNPSTDSESRALSVAAHTPGPWTAIQPHPGQWAIVPVKHGAYLDQWTLAYIRDFQSNDEANARLIAAAPELLEALSELYSAGLWTSDSFKTLPKWQRQIIDQARVTINKAKGQP